AAAVVQAAGSVQHAQVARTQIPFLVERLAGLGVVLVVAGEQIALDADLPDLAGRAVLAGLRVAYAYLHAGQRHADGVQTQVQRVIDVGDRASAVSLGQAVDVAYLVHPQLHDAPQLFGGADGGAAAQGRQVAPRTVRVVLQRVSHIGRAVEQRAAL